MLPINHQGLTSELVKLAREELGETDEIRVHAIEKLKRLIKDEPDFNPCTDDAFLTRFLRARKYDVDRAFKNLKHYYTYKAQNSGVLTDLKPSDIFVKMDGLEGSALEHRNNNGWVIGYLRLGQVDLDKVSPQDLLASGILATEVILNSEATQIYGYCLVIDVAGFSLRKARYFASPSYLKKMVNAIQDCLPSRIKAFHFVNEPFYFDIIISIIRSFLSEKLKNRFFCHGNNLESLHEHLNPKFLPEELGGEQGPAEINEKKFIEMICEHEDYFKRMNTFGFTGKTLQKLMKENHNAEFN